MTNESENKCFHFQGCITPEVFEPSGCKNLESLFLKRNDSTTKVESFRVETIFGGKISKIRQQMMVTLKKFMPVSRMSFLLLFI